jgi:hypothetical protein
MRDEASGAWFVENLFRPLLLAAMTACLAVPLTLILEWLLVGWDGGFLPYFAFLAALEGVLSERLLRRQGIRGWSYAASRLAELVILLIMLKFASYLPSRLDQLVAELWALPANWQRFVTDLDLVTGVLFALLWAGAVAAGRQLADLDAGQAKPPPPEDSTSPEYYLWLTQPSIVQELQEALDALGELFLWGGVALLLTSAVIHAFVPGLATPVLATLLYFALGVALLSQARFSVTRAGWDVQGIPVQASIARRWLVWAVVFVVAVSSVALLLPTRYGMGPVLAIYRLVLLLAQVLMLLFTFLLFLMAMLFALLTPSQQQPELPSLDKLPPLLPQQAPPSGGALPWLEVLMSVLFWTVILAIVGYATLRFLRDRAGLLTEGGKGQGLWVRLLDWLRRLRRHWGILGHQAQARLARLRPERAAARPAPSALSRFLSLRRLPPRERVRYFYLSAERRAAAAGQPRSPGQTPYEYQASLDGCFPELEPDLAGLTEAFIEARYSHQPIGQPEAEAVKPLWQRIKALLRRRLSPL